MEKQPYKPYITELVEDHGPRIDTVPFPQAPAVEPQKQVMSIVGSARCIQTAVLVTEYMRKRICVPHSEVIPDRVHYRLKEFTECSGWWAAEIYVHGELSLDESKLFVDTCRAFVAGRGELWA